MMNNGGRHHFSLKQSIAIWGYSRLKKSLIIITSQLKIHHGLSSLFHQQKQKLDVHHFSIKRHGVDPLLFHQQNAMVLVSYYFRP